MCPLLLCLGWPLLGDNSSIVPNRVALLFVAGPAKDLQIVRVVLQFRPVFSGLDVIDVDVSPAADFSLAGHASAAVLCNGLGLQYKPLF